MIQDQQHRHVLPLELTRHVPASMLTAARMLVGCQLTMYLTVCITGCPFAVLRSVTGSNLSCWPASWLLSWLQHCSRSTQRSIRWGLGDHMRSSPLGQHHKYSWKQRLQSSSHSSSSSSSSLSCWWTGWVVRGCCLILLLLLKR
jgi:hypothetical protein